MGWQMLVANTKRKQAGRKVDQALKASKAFEKPLGGWLSTFLEAISMGAPALAARLEISRNSVYSSIEKERLGSISVNQLEKMADAMGGKLVYAIVPREGDIEQIVMTQARKKAKRIVQRTRAHMALEEQTEGLRSEEDMIGELASDMVREMPRDFWK
jgi:predicted DNA-binding mobile mystery protein A